MNKKLIFNFVIIIIIVNILLSCGNDKKKIKEKYVMVQNGNLFYNLTDYDQIVKLPKKLEEISGIHIINENIFVCVQDEKGKVYFFDTEKEEIIDDMKFAKKGDYEDIEVINNDIYILKSNGTIYKIEDYKESAVVSELNTELNEDNNTEGLCYDSIKNTLLIACKDEQFIENPQNDKLAVYSFSLTENKLKTNPEILINKNELFEKVNKASSEYDEDFDFSPSGIAINPIDQNIYIISTKDRCLAVVSQSGEVIEAHYLPRIIFKQPEGICFNSKGDLFISNEGRSSKGNILKFNLLK